MTDTVTVALDGLGAERGPEVVVAGARAAAADGIGVRVFGDPGELAALKGVAGVEVIETSEWVGNDVEPVAAVRSQPDSSIVRAARDVTEGGSSALASAGSTGATMAAATFALRRLHGVRRPALAVQLLVPGREGPPTLLLDAGANAEARPLDLVQFAFLGAAFSESVLGVARPRVALLSVGEESKKGSQVVIAAHEQLARWTDGVAGEPVDAGFDFTGNVEGRDLLAGTADVIVTEGFAGNIALKTAEGTARQFAQYLRGAMNRTWQARLGYLLARAAFQTLREKMDPRKSNGGVFLGLNGVVIKSHGGTDAEGFASAIDIGYDMVRYDLLVKIGESLARDRRETKARVAAGAAS